MSNDYIKNGVNLCRNCQNANTEDCFFACNGSGSYYSPFTAEELYGFGVNNYNVKEYDKAIELWREAADMGHQEAKKALAKLETSAPAPQQSAASSAQARFQQAQNLHHNKRYTESIPIYTGARQRRIRGGSGSCRSAKKNSTS